MKEIESYDLWRIAFFMTCGAELVKIERRGNARRGNCCVTICNVPDSAFQQYENRTAAPNLSKFNRQLGTLKRQIRDFELSDLAERIYVNDKLEN